MNSRFFPAVSNGLACRVILVRIAVEILSKRVTDIFARLIDPFVGCLEIFVCY